LTNNPDPSVRLPVSLTSILLSSSCSSSSVVLFFLAETVLKLPDIY